MATRRKAQTKKGAAATRAAAPIVRRASKPATTAPASDRVKAVQEAFDNQKKMQGVVRRMGDTSVEKVEVFPTASLALNMALGVGGLPRGRVVEIYGPESGGKTTLALEVIARAQREGNVCAYIDAEHAMEPTYCRKLGIDIDQLLIAQPDNGEQAFDVCETAVTAGADLIVVDSVAALTPKAEIEGDYGDSFVGLQARMMSQGLRKLTGLVGKSRCCVVFINQIREKIGVMFGSPETTTGGRALKFYSSVRVDIRRIGPAEAGRDVGNKCKAKVVKNKLAPPFREAEFDLIFGSGVDQLGELITIGKACGVIETSGAWLSFNGERMGNGHAAAVLFLQHSEVTLNQLRTAVMERAQPTEGEPVEDADTDEE